MPSLPVLRVLFAVFAVFALLAGVGTVSASEDQGVWVKRDTSFQYLGFTTTYSCDGLADKLKILLIAAGARGDAKAIAGGCASSFGRPDQFARARLTFYTLQPAVNADNASAPVNGVWRSVALMDRSPRELRLGDCELVEQFRDKVLPMFTTRNLENGMTCVPKQLSGSVIKLKFEVFAKPPVANKK
jgi:hypothetical protein